MKFRYAAVMAGLSLGLMSGAAKAAYVIDIDQVGANVVATGSGTLDLTDLSFNGYQTPSEPGVSGNYIEVGNNVNFSNSADVYVPIFGPRSFGTGSFVAASSSSGYVVGVDATGGGLFVPRHIPVDGFDFGTSTATFGGTTIAKLGLTAGHYVYTWGPIEEDAAFVAADVDHADTLTINIGVSNVPLPASAPMFGAALAALGAVGYGLKRKKEATAA